MGTLAAYVDNFIFIKRGYSLWKHLVPFSIAGLLLLTLSVPEDNLLLKLASLLQQLQWTLLPAGLLTIVATLVYYRTIRAQVRQAYLWPDRDLRRTILTSCMYIVLCALMAFAVLQSATPKTAVSQDVTVGNIWACYLIAVLSLTGVGWSGPSSWAESVGIKPPDYTAGRSSAQKLTVVLRGVRKKAQGEKEDVVGFAEATKGLRSSIETNLELEPEWARPDLQKVITTMTILTEQATEWSDDDNITREFAVICRCQRRSEHMDFTQALIDLGNHRQEWQYQGCVEDARE